MDEKPTVKPYAYIKLGGGRFSRPAIVSQVYKDHSYADIEVVYLDDTGQAIDIDLAWKDGKWKFKGYGGNADRYDRLEPFIDKLKRDQRPHG